MLKESDILDYFLFLKSDKNLGQNDHSILEFMIE